jgi:hypothetical protein
MAKVHSRGAVPGPAFIRLLAGLTELDVPTSGHVLSDRLSQWLDWNRAIVLSKALDDALPAPPAGAPTFDRAQDQDCSRVRAALAAAISGDARLLTARQRPDGEAPADPPRAPAEVDDAVFRRRHQDHQRAMQAATGRLRGHLRDMLAQRSDQHARLAEIDAVMELTLSTREQTLLATVPELLGRHFHRLRDAAQQALDEAALSGEVPTAPSGAWLDVFRYDMQRVLLAELDVRFQPIDGLLAALRPQ